VVFVVEYSVTISEIEYHQLLDFVVNVVAQLDVDSGRVRVSVITFSDIADIQFRLSTFNTVLDIIEAVRTLPYRGYHANIGEAFRTLRNDVFRYVANR